jgi:hypothetical protein
VSTEANKALTSRLFEVINGGELGAFDEILAHGAPGGVPVINIVRIADGQVMEHGGRPIH